MTTPQLRRQERHLLSPDRGSPQPPPLIGRRWDLGLPISGLARSTAAPLGMVLSISLALAWPALGSAASCTIAPNNPTINMAGSVSWSATYSGFSGTPTYAWTFPGGNPASSTSATRSVSYANAGPSTTSLKVTRGGTSATCTSTVTVRDTQAPSTTSGLGTTVVSGTQINLAWTAATDNVGVTGYRVERCTGATCTNFAQIATPTTTSFSNTGLTAGTAYRYRVRAADAAGNLGGYSAIVTATTPAGDTTKPVVSIATPTPGPYHAPGIVPLNATATDNVGVTKVEFYDGA
ncbi:MAG: fibronectin type III domain-containing protein, partial [Chromatiaceae bacterium]